MEDLNAFQESLCKKANMIVENKIRFKRSLKSYFAALVICIILPPLFSYLNVSNVWKVFMLSAFVITFFTALTGLLSMFVNLFPVRKNDKFVNQSNIVFKQLIESEIENTPGKIESLKQGIDALNKMIINYTKKQRLEINERTEKIDEMKNELELLKQIKSNYRSIY